MKKLIVANWKMNMGGRPGITLAREIAEGFNDTMKSRVDIVICPPFTNMEGVQFECEEADIAIGGQDCSFRNEGAYTGEISANMLKEAFCDYVILGHSERRQYFKETDKVISDKAKIAHNKDLTTIICVGETESQRDAGDQNKIVSEQLKAAVPDCCEASNTVIAYEPVWAIGTGKVASIKDVEEMHAHIRSELKARFQDGGQFAILYGGSVKESNAKDILFTQNVDGALVGGASLKSEDFLGIVKAV